MQKIKKITLLILSILLINVLFINCYATAVTVTKENLNASLQKFVSSSENDKDYKINVSDDIITIVSDGKNYNLNYELTEKPKFTFEVPIEKGMSYKEFEEQTGKMTLPMIGYIAVANIQGVEIDDASTYFLLSYLKNGLSGSWSSKDSYVIIDDTNLSDGVTIDKSNQSSKTIYASEFGEKVMEYVNYTYKDKQTITDASSGINTYEFTVERKDVTETSCKLVSSLTVNVDSDFSKIKDYESKVEESVLSKDITKDNADYAITLKVGQKWRIETTEKITGYQLSGSACDYEDINEKCAEITGKKVGNANGYIYIGASKKSFYITVEENTENKTLDTIKSNIDTTTTNNQNNQNSQNTSKEQQEQNKTTQQLRSASKDNTTAKTILPQTGMSNIIYIIVAYIIISLIVFIIKHKKYEDVK